MGVARPTRQAILVLAGVAGVAAVYFRFAGNGFLYDDYLIVLGRDPIGSWNDVVRLFVEPFYSTLTYYRPLAAGSYLLQRSLFGDGPAAFHAVNAVLAGLVAATSYLFLRLDGLRLRAEAALLAAVLFAIHPVASSCAFPISGRDTLLASAWILVGLFGVCRGGRASYLLGLGAFAAALLTKEMSVIFPLLMASADALGISADAPGRSPGKWLSRYLPFGLALAGYALVRRALFSEVDYPAGSVELVALSFVYTGQVLVVPFRELLYEPALEAWLSPWRLGIAAAVVAGAGLAWSRLDSPARARGIFWAAWIAISVLPTANIVWQETRFAERYVFLAGLGLFGLAATLLSSGWNRRWVRRAGVGSGLVLVAVYTALTFARGPLWSEEAFYPQWLSHAPDHVMARYNWANVLEEAGRPDEAREQYEEVLRLDPRHDRAHNNLGKVLIGQGRVAEARARFEEAVRLDPANRQARNNLGGALAMEGRLEDATRQFRAAIEIDPRSATSHYNLGHALLQTGAPAEAEMQFRTAVSLDPDYAEAYAGLGAALLDLDRADEAAAELRTALGLRPDLESARRMLERVTGPGP